MNILIFTEGGGKIGYGHITRCLSIYQAFIEKGFSPTFIVNSDDIENDFLININYIKFNWLIEQEELFNLIKNADIIIIDSYLADLSILKKISEQVKITVYIDDTNRLDYPKGIIINGCIFAENLNYSKKEGVTYLLGIQYQPLRKVFWDFAKKEIRKSIQSVMVTFGGNDIRNLTPAIQKILNKKYPELKKNIIIGNGFNNTVEIEKVKDAKTKLYYNPDAEVMKEIMLSSDIAISSGGQTLYELARVGTATLAIKIIENQNTNITGWVEAGFIDYIGQWNDKNLLDNIQTCINNYINNSKLLTEKYRIGRNIIDGKGAFNIINELLKIYNKN